MTWLAVPVWLFLVWLAAGTLAWAEQQVAGDVVRRRTLRSAARL